MKPERRWAKASQSNPVLQRSAPSEGLHLEPVRHARPLNTALDPRGANQGGEVLRMRNEDSEVSTVARCEKVETRSELEGVQPAHSL
jgi:hypothetical protein